MVLPRATKLFIYFSLPSPPLPAPLPLPLASLAGEQGNEMKRGEDRRRKGGLE
jgi:hypothetical protein